MYRIRYNPNMQIGLEWLRQRLVRFSINIKLHSATTNHHPQLIYDELKHDEWHVTCDYLDIVTCDM